MIAMGTEVIRMFFFLFFGRHACATVRYQRFRRRVCFVPAFVMFRDGNLAVHVPRQAERFVLVTRRLHEEGRAATKFCFRGAERLRARFISEFYVFLLVRFKLHLVNEEEFRVVCVAFFCQAGPAECRQLKVKQPLSVQEVVVTRHSVLARLLLFTYDRFTGVCIIVFSGDDPLAVQ